MNLGNAQSNPTTPDGYDEEFFNDVMSLGPASNTMNHSHSRKPSNGSSAGGSPRNHNAMRFTPTGPTAQVAPQSQPTPRANPLHSLEQSSYRTGAATHQANVINFGQPASRFQNLGIYTEGPSMHQQAPANYTRVSAATMAVPIHAHASDGTGLYDFTFSGMDVVPSRPSHAAAAAATAADWNMVHGGNYSAFIQPPPVGFSDSLATHTPYVPPRLLSDPAELSATIASLTPQQRDELRYRMAIRAQIQQYAESLPRAATAFPSDSTMYADIWQTDRDMGMRNSLANTSPYHSPVSTPSLDECSPPPTLTRSPLFESGNLSASLSHPAVTRPGPVVRDPPTPPSLVANAMPVGPASPPMPAPPKKKKTSNAASNARPGHRSVGTHTSMSSILSAGSSSASVSIAASTSNVANSIPLRVRVEALPRDKRAMFERAGADFWDPKASTEADQASNLTHHELQFLEDLYALISSDELRYQREIPDELVEPILETVLLPRADAHRGSRGGAAEHVCRWSGCGKAIKRLDHSRNHIREHCKSKPHSCGANGAKGCGQTFLRTDDLKRHQKTHCSVLRSGPGRRPRSVRGVRRYADDEEERDSEDMVSLDGGDDDDYRPVHARAASSGTTATSSSSITRELASRLRRQRQRTISYAVADEDSTEESDPGFGEHDSRRPQMSNVRQAVDSPVDAGVRSEDGSVEGTDSQKVRLAYGKLMASCSSQFITALVNRFLCILLLKIVGFKGNVGGCPGLLGKTVR